jgi:hypothetical protein
MAPAGSDFKREKFALPAIPTAAGNARTVEGWAASILPGTRRLVRKPNRLVQDKLA